MTFKRASEIRWERLFPEQEWGACEECGRTIPKGTVPHHTKYAQGGLGGKRIHDPDQMAILCMSCHEAKHSGTRRN